MSNVDLKCFPKEKSTNSRNVDKRKDEHHNQDQEQDLQRQFDNDDNVPTVKHSGSGGEAFSYQRERHKMSDSDPQPSSSFQESGRQQNTDYSKVNDRLEEFIKYFVKEFEAKLQSYHLILEGEAKKAGKFSDTFSGKIGQGVGGGIGGVVGLFLGSPTAGAKVGTAAGKAGGEKLGSMVGNKKHTKEVTKLLDLIDLSQKDKPNFRRILVDDGLNIFQSFEMQFMRVSTHQGPKKAMQQLAKDATNRAIQYMKKKKDISISESVILGESKKEAIHSISPGFEIQYEYQSCKKVWNTANLYDKAGVVIQGRTSSYYKKKDGKSETTKYGYRRLLVQESWNKLKDKYDSDNIVDSKSGQFTDYQYTVSPRGLGEQSKSILGNLNIKDKNLGEDRIKKILEEVKKDILEEIDFLKKQSRGCTEDRKILAKIEANLKNLNIDEYLEKFKHYFEEAKQERQNIAKSIEASREESRENFNQLNQKQDIHHDDNKNEHKKTQEGIQRVEGGIVENSKKIEEIHEVVTQNTIPKNESIWYDVKGPGELFTGRKQELSDLHSKIQRNSEKPTVISQMTSISGLGGIGKTELARKYIHKHSKVYDNNIIWINAENEGTLIESFQRLAKDKLRIHAKDADGKEIDIKSIVEELYKFFSKRKSLFVFDNAEKNEYFNKFLPLRSLTPDDNKPYVLITSRNREWERGMEVLDLSELKLKDAVMFVKKGLNIPQENKSLDQEIECLVEKLQRFPLAIKQAIAYIDDQSITEEFSVSNYLEKYKKKTKDLLDSEAFKGIENDYAKTTFTTWRITIDKIASDKQYGQLALKILDTIAYFAPESIYREMFLDLAGGDETTLKSGVRLLVKYSMVNGEQKQSVLSIHRLVQEVTRLELKGQETEEKVLKNALELVQKNMGKENLEHAVSVWSYTSKYNELVKDFSKLPSYIINRLGDEIRYEEAYLFGKQSSYLLKNILGAEHLSTLLTQNNIAEVLLKQAKFKEALEVYRDVFNGRKEVLGENHPDTLRTWHGMAWTLDRLGEFKEALEIFQEILKKKEKIYSESSNPEVLYDIFQIKNRIAWLLINQSKNQEPLNILEGVFSKQRETLGADNSYTLYTQHTIAVVLAKQGKTKEALKIFREVLEKRTKILGQKHPDTLNTQHHIAQELRALGERGRDDVALNSSAEACQEVFRIRKEVLGENHSDTLDSQQGLAFTLLRLGKSEKALEIYKEIFEKRKEQLGADQAVIQVKHQMAMALDHIGEHQNALTIYKEVFKKRIEILGTGHEMTVNTLKNLLIMFLEYEDLDIVNFLANEGADFNVHFENGETPLMWIIETKIIEAVKILVQNGADILARNNHHTVLHEAVGSRNKEIVKLILEKIKEKFNQDPQQMYKSINAQDTEGDTPLMWAADDGYQESIQLLLDSKADPNMQNNNGETPLRLAQEKLAQNPENDDFKTTTNLLLSVTNESKSQQQEEQV